MSKSALKSSLHGKLKAGDEVKIDGNTFTVKRAKYGYRGWQWLIEGDKLSINAVSRFRGEREIFDYTTEAVN